MRLSKSTLLAALLVAVCGVVVQAQPKHAPQKAVAKTSSVQLGDKVVVIPNPEGFEEGSSQFKEIKDRFQATESPQADFLLAHLPESECRLLRNGGSLQLNRYTKVSISKALRAQTIFNPDMKAAIEDFRKNSGAILDPDGPTMKNVMEKAEKGLTDVTSTPIGLNLGATQNLGEFDVRPEVFSVMLLFTYNVESNGTKTTVPMLCSMTFLKVQHRILFVNVYRKISSLAALKTELKPGIADVKQFTTKWVDEILAANQ
jgi:hypothetical protein